MSRPVVIPHSDREIRVAVVKGLHKALLNMEEYLLILKAASDRLRELREYAAAVEVLAALDLFEDALPMVKNAWDRVSLNKKEQDGSEEYVTLAVGDPMDCLNSEVHHEDDPRERSSHKRAGAGKRKRKSKAGDY